MIQHGFFGAPLCKSAKISERSHSASQCFATLKYLLSQESKNPQSIEKINSKKKVAAGFTHGRFTHSKHSKNKGGTERFDDTACILLSSHNLTKAVIPIPERGTEQKHERTVALGSLLLLSLNSFSVAPHLSAALSLCERRCDVGTLSSERHTQGTLQRFCCERLLFLCQMQNLAIKSDASRPLQ